MGSQLRRAGRWASPLRRLRFPIRRINMKNIMLDAVSGLPVLDSEGLSAGRRATLALVLAGLTVLVGCAGPQAKPSDIMKVGSPPVLVPAVGKSLVLIHRPRAAQGYGLYTGIWEGTNFIADLGNGHSAAYLCDPGVHYFLNRSVERVGVVEAHLLPDHIYDLRLGTCGAWIASFQIEPVKKEDRMRAKLPQWTQEHLWVERNDQARKHELERTAEVELILKDFVSGAKNDRLRHLATEDHR
jgi:hypothetical protein